MSTLSTPRDLFLHELGDILYVEQKLAGEVIPKLIEEVQAEELRTGLERHLEQTRAHVTNVEQVFDVFGEQPLAEECIGFEGLKKEHDKLVEESTRDLIDLVNAGAVARTEHYEIAAYESLITMARALGEPEAVGMLEENLKEEKEALREVESAAKTLTKEKAKAMSS